MCACWNSGRTAGGISSTLSLSRCAVRKKRLNSFQLNSESRLFARALRKSREVLRPDSEEKRFLASVGCSALQARFRSARRVHFFRSNPVDEDSFMTTPAHSVPASQLARGARSEEVVAKHKKYLWPSVTNYFQQPLVADRGEMQHLWDLDGNRYLDFFGGILTVSVGHCNPKITSKVNAQVNRLQHTSTLYPNQHIVALAERIAQITPGNLQQSFFTNSGTEANEAAILLARMSTGNFDVVALRHAYSGGSALAKAVTAHAPYRKAGVISVGISHAVNPYCYRCPLHLKYPDCEVACAGDVENLIQTGTSGNIAAFMAEPIQGVGGFITPPKEYFKIVFKIVKKYGALFIADEERAIFLHDLEDNFEILLRRSDESPNALNWFGHERSDIPASPRLNEIFHVFGASHFAIGILQVQRAAITVGIHGMRAAHADDATLAVRRVRGDGLGKR